MAIIFGSDTGLRQNSFDMMMENFQKEYQYIKNGITTAFTTTRLTQPPSPPQETVFVDSGFSNVPGTAFLGSSDSNVDDIQTRQIVSQQPVLTVYVKKRAFRSLRNENDLKLLDSGERLFLRATKILFENKCQQIAAYEALTKAATLLNEESDLDYNRISSIIEYLQDHISNTQSLLRKQIQASSSATQKDLQKYNSALAKQKADEEQIASYIAGLTELRTKNSNLRHATRTNWVVDINQPDSFLVGRGTGVIELTLINELNTSLLLDGSVGSINFTMQDPYNLTKITTDELEAALSAAQAEIKGPENYSGPQFNLERAQRREEQLRQERKNRIASAFSRTFGGISSAFNLEENSGNAVLSGTDNTEIIFEVDVSSAASDRVKASIGDNTSFNKNNFRMALLQLPPEQQTTIEENTLIEQIFFYLEEYVKEVQRLNGNYISDNQNDDVIHARRNLRVHYLGKSIIQPMDSVNVYIRGNTFKQNELCGPLSILLNNSPFIRNFLNQNDNLSDVLLEEEMKVLGIDDLDIPVDVYRTLRTDSLMRNAGTHVFGGIITTVSENYSAEGGVYTTTVSGASNMQWLSQSRVNRAPALDQTQGLVEDPLTPFDIKTDEATGLILDSPPLNDDNQQRKADKILNYNSGANLGDKFDESNYPQDYIPNGDGTALVQYKHTPGIVYKWKQGIIVATRKVNLKNSLTDQEDQTQKSRRDIGLSVVVNDPFAGQDAADIVSILVTGFPHNYESFYKNAKGVGTYVVNAQANSPETYFHSFFDIHRSQNRTFGNFQPFKSIHVDPKVFHQRLAFQEKLGVTSKKINTLRSQLAKVKDERQKMARSKLFDGDTPISKTNRVALDSVMYDLQTQEQNLTKQINDLSSEFKATANAASSKKIGLRLYGTDYALDFGGSSSESEDQNMKEKYKRTSLQNSIMQFRPQYNCKMNSDDNLFIVAEEYDKDVDIQAFIRNTSSQNQSLWESQYKDPKDICVTVARALDFEFFCLAEDTVILTKGPDNEIKSKFIQDIIDGDNVLSINQKTGFVSWKPATLKSRYLSDNEYMIELRDGQGQKIIMSNGHKLLDRNLKEITAQELHCGIEMGTAETLPNTEKKQFIQIGKLFEHHKWFQDFGDFFKIGGQGSKHLGTMYDVKLDIDIAWLFGMYVAEGSISDIENRNNKLSRGYHTIFSLNYDEIETAHRICKIIKEKFNILARLYRYKKYNRITVDVGSFVFTKIIKSIFGCTTAKTKSIPCIIWNAPNEIKLSFISGLIEGDGTFDRRLSITSISKKLVNDISQLLLMMGIDSKIDKYNKIHIYKKENIKNIVKYCNTWRHFNSAIEYLESNKDFNGRKKINKFAIKYINKIDYNKPVYDIEVEENHTFLIGHTWSHNCDTQGHIQFRPPRYNRIPLSLLLKMFLIDRREGRKLYPPFLISLFESRSKNIDNELEIVDIEIAIETALLKGKTPSSSDLIVVKSIGNNESLQAGTTIDSVFIYTPNSEDFNSKKIDDVVKYILDKRKVLRSKVAGSSVDPDSEEEANNVKNEIESLNNNSKPNIYSNRLTHENKLAQLVSSRQRLAELKEKMDKRSNEANISMPAGVGNNPPPDMLNQFYDLIEDDYNDFLGPNSSKRFIIYDDQIIHSTFTESCENVQCRAEVNGELDYIGEGPGILAEIPVLTAHATDFDLWRQYGYKFDGAVSKPFLKNAETQCAPYAIMLLNQNRKKAVKGTLIVYGNEYYQLGDVVYINSRDTLFYITSVSHQFSYAGTFTTTLTLEFGHPLGEYIPTPFDVIGKNLILHQTKFNKVMSSRQTAGPSLGRHLASIIFPNDIIDNVDAKKRMLSGDYANFNLNEIKNALAIASVYIADNTSNTYPKIEVRGFVMGNESINKVRSQISVVRDILQHPTGKYENDHFLKLNKRFINMALQKNQLSSFSDTIRVNDSLKPSKTSGTNNVRRQPKEEVFSLVGRSSKKIENIIEIVLIFEDPEKE